MYPTVGDLQYLNINVTAIVFQHSVKKTKNLTTRVVRFFYITAALPQFSHKALYVYDKSHMSAFAYCAGCVAGFNVEEQLAALNGS